MHKFKTINLPLDKARYIERELIDAKASYSSEKVARNGRLSYVFTCANPPEELRPFFCLPN